MSSITVRILLAVRRSLVYLSGLPLPPPEFPFGVQNGRNLTGHRSTSWMLSDMVWAGSFHHCIMTSGGRMAHPRRTVQLGSELTLPTRPAPHTAEIQTQANVTFLYLSCILKVYVSSANGAVPKRTPNVLTGLGDERVAYVSRDDLAACWGAPWGDMPARSTTGQDRPS